MVKSKTNTKDRSEGLTAALTLVMEQAMVLASMETVSSKAQKRYLDESTNALASAADSPALARWLAALLYDLAVMRNKLRHLEISSSKYAAQAQVDATEIVKAAVTARRALSGDNESIQRALDGVTQPQGTLISALVGVGIKVGRRSVAKAGGKARSQKHEELKKFAIALYRTRSFVSTKNAANILWPTVKAEGIRINQRLSETSGEDTLYRWLREENKNPTGSVAK